MDPNIPWSPHGTPNKCLFFFENPHMALGFELCAKCASVVGSAQPHPGKTVVVTKPYLQDVATRADDGILHDLIYEHCRTAGITEYSVHAYGDRRVNMYTGVCVCVCVYIYMYVCGVMQKFHDQP